MCRKFGHLVHRCYHRFNVHFTRVTYPSFNSDQPTPLAHLTSVHWDDSVEPDHSTYVTKPVSSQVSAISCSWFLSQSISASITCCLSNACYFTFSSFGLSLHVSISLSNGLCFNSFSLCASFCYVIPLSTCICSYIFSACWSSSSQQCVYFSSCPS